jgi:hypothetical protein
MSNLLSILALSVAISLHERLRQFPEGCRPSEAVFMLQDKIIKAIKWAAIRGYAFVTRRS